MSANYLDPAPLRIVNDQGQVQFGKFAGAVDCIDWSGLSTPYQRSAVWRYFHHKQWQYVALSTERLFCGVAIVDVGWINTAFVYVFDRARRTMLADISQDGIPGLTARLNSHPAHGAASHFRFAGKSMAFAHDQSQQAFSLRVQCGELHIDAKIDASRNADNLLAIGEVAQGSVHATLKSPGLALDGVVHVAGETFSLHGGVASFDHSNGFLARETAWRWASAHNLEMGFNLQAGYFGSNENAMWLDGKLIALGAAHFEFDDQQALAPWHIYTDDGLLDLHFHPEGCRSENKNLLVAASRYRQPIGCFSGFLKVNKDAAPRRVEQLVGVTEDHFSRW
ncbi:MAG: DUF2804 domain-containing protein [Burkholderiales bacterium]|nr:DUF2804 domain-containing protein [Burkholderiales bacterium]